jgi:ribonuclease HIII
VAAASILARAEFVRGLRELETEFGQALPPGAGPPVIKAGREFVKTFGRDQLGQVAKLHFKTIESL